MTNIEQLIKRIETIEAQTKELYAERDELLHQLSELLTEPRVITEDNIHRTYYMVDNLERLKQGEPVYKLTGVNRWELKSRKATKSDLEGGAA